MKPHIEFYQTVIKPWMEDQEEINREIGTALLLFEDCAKEFTEIKHRLVNALARIEKLEGRVHELDGRI